MTIALAQKALEDNATVHMIYAAGSFPGKVREIIPRSISANSITAFCKLREEVRTFELEKIVFIAPDEVDAYELAELPMQIDSVYQLASLLNPFLKKEHSLKLRNTSIKLVPKLDDAPLLELTYSEVDSDGFKKVKPWLLNMENKKWISCTYFQSAATKFYELFCEHYKGEPNLKFELNYLAEQRKQWKPRAIASKNLICAVVKDGKGNPILKTEHWAFNVKYGHRDALKLEYLERMEDKKPVMRWVQGTNLAFKQGAMFESNQGSRVLQVNYGVEMGWDVDTNSMYEGIVTFDTFLINEGKWVKDSSYSVKQTEFLRVLITGDIGVAEIVTSSSS